MSGNQQNKQADKQPQETQQKDGKPQETDRATVTFIKPWHRYVRGDIAGFSKKDAANLVHMKVAVEGTKLPAQAKAESDEPAA